MSQTFLLEPDIIAAAENILPELNTDLVLAKNYLKTQSAASGDSLYDHLVDMVHKLLAHKPPDAADDFERFSWDVKREKFRPNFDLLNELFLAPPQLLAVKQTEEMFLLIESKAENVDDLSEEEPDLDLEEEFQKPKLADLLEHNQNFKEGGYGLPDSECFTLYMALKMLGVKEGVANIRFFGKIFGLKANYYVAETDLTTEEMEKRIRDFDEKDMVGEGEVGVEGEDGGEEKPKKLEAEEEAAAEEIHEEIDGEQITEKPSGPVPPKLPPIPVSTWKPPPPIPPERPGEGVNRKVYWVCHCPGEKWICLPDVTPDHIRVARLAVHALTGDLEAEVILFPPFEGLEKHYLRAQIARISAATAVSPQGFYGVGSGEEEEDFDGEDGGDMDLNPNPYYQGHPIKDLLDPELSYWVHHERHILKQGRTIWWNQGAGMDEGMEEEDDEAFPKQQPETGPPLMTSLSEDDKVEHFAAWTARCSSRLAVDRALVTLRSNLWPGAVAYASGKKSECMYVGWGLKFLPPNFSPMQLPKVQEEYPLGPEIMEMADPTFADEEAYRILHLPPEPAQEMIEEAFPEEEEEEDEDDD